MIEIFNVNAFAEAMFYYSGRANNESIEKRLAETIKRCPGHGEELKRLVKPAALLEKMLDSRLDIDDALVCKYFKELDGRYPNLPFGFCPASIIVSYSLTDRLEYSVDEMCRYLREFTKEELMFSLCFGLTDKYEAIYPDENAANEFLRRVENSGLSFENKWMLLDIAFNYQAHISRLLSLIIPAAELIKASENEYKFILDDFRALYSSDNMQIFSEPNIAFKFAPSDVIRISPLIFGFDKVFAAFKSCYDSDTAESEPSVSVMFLGAARHLINQSSQDEVSALSEKMQSLSDRTRLEMLFYLCSHRVYGQELCAKFGLARSALSYHVAKLLSAGFITAELSGSKTYYSADKEGIRRMLDAFEQKLK